MIKVDLSPHSMILSSSIVFQEVIAKSDQGDDSFQGELISLQLQGNLTEYNSGRGKSNGVSISNLNSVGIDTRYTNRWSEMLCRNGVN